MKKILMFFGLFAAMTASAELYYGAVNTREYAGNDTTPSDDNRSYYSGYLCTAAVAQSLFSSSSDITAMTTAIHDNYGKVLSELGKLANKKDGGVCAMTSDPIGYDGNQYSVSGYLGSNLEGEYVALVTYNSGNEYAFRVLGYGSAFVAKTGLVFDDGGSLNATESYGAWTAAAAPEPAVEYVAPVYVDGVASNGIAYWTTNEVYSYTVVESSADPVTWGTDGATNWYVVKDADVQIDGGVICAGHVNLILCEGAKLVVTNLAWEKAGIKTDASGSFTVYGQPDGSGALEVFGGEDAAGIGGDYEGDGSNITINGGTVTANGYGGAGIGGGDDGNGSHITINGGTVTANGGEKYGAGIGGGWYGNGSYITINGGNVTAKGGIVSAAIGGGWQGIGSNIKISDAVVFACGVVADNKGAVSEPDIIGNGYQGENPASGVVIGSTAKVLFNLTAVWNWKKGVWLEEMASMPATFDGMTIMTPETQTVDRVLAGGITDWTAATTFALTNAVTGATGTIAVNGGWEAFAGTNLKLKHADNALTLLTHSGVQVGDDAWAAISDGACTVSGTGDMWSYDKAGSSPLWGYRESITNLVVESGVTGIGTRFFENMWWLRDVQLGADCTNVEARAFKKCYGLTNVTSVASGVLAIGDYVFSGCHSLQAMTFADTPTFGTESYSLQAAIYMDGDIPIIYPIPQLKVGELATALRIKGKQKLGDADWTDVTEMADEERKTYHFFKVVMP